MTRRQFLLAGPAVVACMALPLVRDAPQTAKWLKRWISYPEAQKRFSGLPRPTNAQMREFYVRVET